MGASVPGCGATYYRHFLALRSDSEHADHASLADALPRQAEHQRIELRFSWSILDRH
jgi:hypothetical protein